MADASTQPREPPVLGHEHRLLLEYLQRYCAGPARARPKHVICAHLVAAGCRLSIRDFETLAGEVALATGDVGSSGGGGSGGRGGFFWCVDRADYAVAYDYLVGRFGPMRRRAERVRARMIERFGPDPDAPTPLLFDAAAGRPAKEIP